MKNLKVTPQIVILLIASNAMAKADEFPLLPKHLSVFCHFSDPVLKKLAHELVDAYGPQGDGYASVCNDLSELCGTFDVMRSVRRAVYPERPMHVLEKVHKPAFLAAVRIASAHPRAVRWFYDESADEVLDEMVVHALATGRSRTEVAEMLNLYGALADRSVTYMRLALNSQTPEVTAALKALNTPEPTEGKKQEAHWKAHYETLGKLQTLLRTTTGMPFDHGDYGTWLFAMRRMKAGGSDLLKVIIEITEDAAKRVRLKAATI